MVNALTSLTTTFNDFVNATKADCTTVVSAFKNGLPTDIDQINAVVLAALRILSSGIMATASILGFSAINLTQLAQFTTTFPTIFAPAISAIIIFHDLYVGASAINSSLANTTEVLEVPVATLLAKSSVIADTGATTATTGRRRKPSQIHFRSGKTLKTVLNEGPSSFASEITERMWALKWILVKTNHLWAPAVAKRLYNVSFPTVSSETVTKATG